MKSGVQPLTSMRGVSLSCGFECNEERSATHIECIMPQTANSSLNAMKSGVQRMVSRSKSSRYLPKFECDEERSANASHRLQGILQLGLNAMKSGVQHLSGLS